ncbi:hypothetical protein F1643_06040 [Azospirillum sp. INR13]|nr:hypothetical protein [Azospirillum sp. INR13]
MSNQQRKKRADRLGKILLAIALVAATTIGYFYWSAIQAHVPLNDQTLCPTSGPTSITAVLIDRTDAFNPVQQAEIRKRLEHVKREVPKHGAIEVYVVAPVVKAVLSPEIKVCNPGNPKDASKWTDNQRMAERLWRARFADKVDQVFVSAVSPDEASSSPIMESIQSLAITAFSDHDAHDREKRLIIVSDMLQHSGVASVYKGVPNFEQSRNAVAFRQLRSDLHGARVEVLLVRRETAKNYPGQGARGVLAEIHKRVQRRTDRCGRGGGLISDVIDQQTAWPSTSGPPPGHRRQKSILCRTSVWKWQYHCPEEFEL